MRLRATLRSDPRWPNQSHPPALRLDPTISIPRRAVGAHLAESVFIVAAIGLSARLGALAVPAALAPDTWWMLPLTALLGVLCADFASGTVHWFCDTFFSERTPIIGPAFILPFREHHADPWGILRHGLVELHGNSSLAVALVLGVLWALPWDLSGRAADFARAWLFFMAAATLATNQVHRWAHSEVPPAPARWLQRSGLILSPEGHARHHRGGFHRSFCITTGWLNPLLDRIDFFPRLERRFRSLARSG
jgi:hypothetical protein